MPRIHLISDQSNKAITCDIVFGKHISTLEEIIVGRQRMS